MSQVGQQVRLSYAFDGVTDNGELILGEGDIVTLTNTDVGEGWYEGQTSSGQIGLFPMSYCEAVSGNAVVSTPATDAYQEPAAAQQDFDDNDDDWDDWQNNYPQQQQAAAAPVAAKSYGTDEVDAHRSSTYSQQSVTSQEDASPKKNVKGGGGGGSLFGKSLFSSFTSSPASAFVGGECKADVSSIPKVAIDQSEDGPYWVATDNPFQCTVSDPTKSSKFSGLKSFIAYNITTTQSSKTVSRRYKHFDWLYEQLSRKYGCVIAIPPLPDKQITGRYEEEFIETRRRQLENWLNRMASHPVILSCEVFQHFINSKDNEKAWKTGKRKAEHDIAVGAALYMTLEPPPQMRLELTSEEKRVESYGRFVKTFDDALKQTILLGNDNVKNFSGPYMKENQKLGQQFSAMSFAFNMDERQVARPLTEAMKLAGKTYEDIGILYQNQPNKDWIPFLDGLHDYHGQLSCYPNILACTKSAIDKQKEVTKQQLEAKCSLDDVDKATNRTELVCFGTQAEVNHLQSYRVGDFAQYMKNFLEQQKAFHLEITAKIEESLNAFNALS